MISNQILQDTIDGIRAISKVNLVVMDVEGRTLAKTIDETLEEYVDAVTAFAESAAESQSLMGYQFFKVNDDRVLEYIILAKGDDDSSYMVGKMAAFQIQSLLIAYKERFDKDNCLQKKIAIDWVFPYRKRLFLQKLNRHAHSHHQRAKPQLAGPTRA